MKILIHQKLLVSNIDINNKSYLIFRVEIYPSAHATDENNHFLNSRLTSLPLTAADAESLAVPPNQVGRLPNCPRKNRKWVLRELRSWEDIKNPNKTYFGFNLITNFIEDTPNPKSFHCFAEVYENQPTNCTTVVGPNVPGNQALLQFFFKTNGKDSTAFIRHTSDCKKWIQEPDGTFLMGV